MILRKINLSLIIVIIGAIQTAYAAPTMQLGTGYADFSDLSGKPPQSDNLGFLYGTIQFTNYSVPPDAVIPPGMRWLSLYMYGVGYDMGPYCTSQVEDPSYLCNFRVTPGDKLSTVLSHIPSSYTLRDGYNIRASSLATICGGMVLSATTDAALATYSIGAFTCGVRPVDVKCDVSPTDLSLDLSMGTNSTISGTVSGTVQCNRPAQIRLRTPNLIDSRLQLGGTGAPVAKLSINGKPSTEGDELTIGDSSSVTIQADVQSGSLPGEFIGSTPLIIEYR